MNSVTFITVVTACAFTAHTFLPKAESVSPNSKNSNSVASAPEANDVEKFIYSNAAE